MSFFTVMSHFRGERTAGLVMKGKELNPELRESRGLLNT